MTHEKQIANFYGDRIIEVKDGKIVSDINNESNDDGSIGKDDTIYLKDYNHIADSVQNGINLSIYSDHEDDLKDLNIKLIVKNKTLYLDVKSPYDKVKIVDKSIGILIKDENYIKKNKRRIN